MSVDYSASFGYGWVLTRDERDAINEISDYKYEDDFLVVDAYSSDGLYFLGIHLGEVDCGRAYALDKQFINRASALLQLEHEFPYERLKDMGFTHEQIADMQLNSQFYLLSRVY